MVDLADPHRRAQVRRFHEERVTELLLHEPPNPLEIFFPIAPQDQHPLHDRQAGIPKKLLHDVLVHAGRGSEHTRADVRDAGQLEQTLYGAILAERPVEDGKDDVQSRLVRGDPRPGGPGRQGRRIEGNKLRHGRVNRGRHRLSIFEYRGKEPVRGRARHPTAFASDADGDDFVLRRVERTQDGGRRS